MANIRAKYRECAHIRDGGHRGIVIENADAGGSVGGA